MILSLISCITPAPAQTFNVIHTFTGGGDGGIPGPTLLIDQAGNFYGTSQTGGGAGQEVVWKLERHRSEWLIIALYTFSGKEGPGPNDLVMGPNGNLYGTNESSGLCLRCGTVFELTPPAIVCKSVSCPWSVTILYHFTEQSDGGTPNGVIFGQDGNLYGTTQRGRGFNRALLRQRLRSRLETESLQRRLDRERDPHLYRGHNDGAFPYAKPTFDAAGNLYGSAQEGGNSGQGTFGCGVTYELSPSGSGSTESILYNFRYSPDGNYPSGGVIFDRAEDLYSTTLDGGTDLVGTIFSLSPSNGGGTENVLYFTKAFGDEFPWVGSLFMETVGNIYGTTPGRNGDPRMAMSSSLVPSMAVGAIARFTVLPMVQGVLVLKAHW